MREELIQFETAKLAKEKGFDVSVNTYYDLSNFFTKDKKSLSEYTIPLDYNSRTKSPQFEERCYISRPTQALLQRWLREVHDIRVLIDFETIDDSETAYTFKIVKYLSEGKGRKKDTWDFYETTYSFNQGGGWYKTYEEALELGLIEGLKLIK